MRRAQRAALPTKVASGPAPAVPSQPAKRSRLKRGNKSTPKGVPAPAPAQQPVVPPTVAPESFSDAVTKRQSCEEILTSGYVQSFVDFFYLTHRPDPKKADEIKTANTVTEDIDVSPQEMQFIRDNLTKAEEARRKGDTPNVYNSYSNLALYFQSNEVNDPKTGVYFYEKCLEISKLTGDNEGEMSANHSLGCVHQLMGDAMNAIQFHERHMELARKHQVYREMESAAKELVRCYREYAEEKEAGGDYNSAVEYFSKALEAARASRDRAAEGAACYRLGKTYIEVQQATKAVNFLHEYERITKDLDDLQGSGAACAALAAAYQSIDDDDKSVQYLENFLAISAKTENLVAQGEACCALGVIFNKRGDYAKSVEFFEKNFEIARSVVSSGVGDNSLVDSSRVYLGMARGNKMLGKYVMKIQFDVNSLLRWKNKRDPLE
ncbi:hypothetical protein TL16_g09371 [Triparma laevis f. inornata]|uniref:Tetratricopeptide repeat protein 29 n=2 Tax=Triparma laevis TaxID=1534972 RepID=A0A9W6ZSU3_9STRA|nr:hypothetical protein TrLO_g2205 [Triparma laevis f. longispina]GMH82760.1 hypothetical protein TL16_g09371 [Triparma laevis f. inornata]